MSLSITLLGTGCPIAHAERKGAAQLIEHSGTRILVDCGSGVTQQLLATGTRGADIDALLITHYHSDHLVDFYQLIVSSWHQGRQRPWTIYAPQPVISNMQNQMETWRDERDLRIAFEQRPNGTAAFDMDFHELSPGHVGQWGDLLIEAIAVEHEPIRPAYGFRFTAGGYRLVLSGDTRPCSAIENAAHGADVLVHEVFIHDQMPLAQANRSKETISKVASYHTIPEDLGPLAVRAAVKSLVLTHFVPAIFDRDRLLDQIVGAFAGPVIVGEDLMKIDVSRRRVTWQGATMAF